MSVIPFAKKRNEGRRKVDMRHLHEVNARVNHGDEHLRVSSAKTLHHGVDLRRAIAKINALQMQHLWSRERLDLGLIEGGCVVLARIGKMIYVLVENDDFVFPVTEFPHKIKEHTVDGALGYWKAVSDLNDN